MSYQLREHTADVGVEAWGGTLGEAFAAVADGLAAAQCDDIPATGDRFSFDVTAENREALLFDLLDRVIYERDVRNVLPIEHDVTVQERDGEWHARVSARGVPLEDIHAREIKAVTYSDMAIERTDGEVRVYVVFDV